MEVKFPPLEEELCGRWTVDAGKSLLQKDIESEGRSVGDVELILYPSGQFLASGIPVNEALIQWIGKRLNDKAKWKVGRGIDKQWQVQLALSNGTQYDFDIFQGDDNKLLLTCKLRQPDDYDKLVLHKAGYP